MVGTDCHLRRAICDSWANLLLTSGDFEGCTSFLSQAATRAAQESAARPHWDEMTELFSRARLAQAQGAWKEACNELSAALKIAVSANDTVWRRRLLVTRAKCKAKLEDTSALSDLVMAAGSLNDPQSLPEHEAMLAVLKLNVDPVAATVHYDRASRVAAAAGNRGLGQDIDRGLRDAVRESRSDWLSSASLDAAVALLELAGHPHILGAEAVALLKGAGCAARLALVATGPAGSRVVDAVGWEPAQAAAAAAATTEGLEHLPLGTRTDETWLLVVEPVRAAGALLHVRGDPEAARHRASPSTATAATKNSAPRCGRRMPSTATTTASGPPNRCPRS